MRLPRANMAALNISVPERTPVDDEDEEESQSSSQSSPLRADHEESDFFEGNNDSQSSIGVPAFQDGLSSDEDCVKPPILRIPAEVLILVFAKLSQPRDLLACMLVCKSWAMNSVALLWHRPNCADPNKHTLICQSLNLEHPYFAYPDFVRRLNLQALADQVNDGSVTPFRSCTRVERLTLTQCRGLTDLGLMELVRGSSNLLALDISGDDQITEEAIFLLADNCPKLQGLNITNCRLISNESMIRLADRCRALKRLKLNGCEQLDDSSIVQFAINCPNLLEVDLQLCKLVSDAPVISILQHSRALRELRLPSCELITDAAFLNVMPPQRTFESLRILDLTSCARLTDAAVERIIDSAPRLRNLVLAKCRNITDVAVNAISKLGKNLHYVHLGHCNLITDDAVIGLVKACNRIRYIDLGCCTRLTDASVTKLATLPKLRRIGLVKCQNITNDSVMALAQASNRARHHFIDNRVVFDAAAHHPWAYEYNGLEYGRLGRNILERQYLERSLPSSLERVHLSYCVNLTMESIIILLNACPRLTHLSLTGVPAFLRGDLNQFCRDAPSEFTRHQRDVFCVFSGLGVVHLRQYLNNMPDPDPHAENMPVLFGPNHFGQQGVPGDNVHFGLPTVNDNTDGDDGDDATLMGEADDDATPEPIPAPVSIVGGSHGHNTHATGTNATQGADDAIDEDDAEEGGVLVSSP